MSKGGGKGRVSNELVAASCAAVLTVYAAGYWRTRDAARRLETQAQERRPVRPQPAVEAPAPIPQPLPAPPVATAEAQPDPIATPLPSPPSPPSPPLVKTPKPAKKPPATAVSPPPPEAAKTAVAAVPSLMSVPLEDMSKPDAVPPPGPLPPGFAGWRDGTYTGWGQSNHGDIEARVIIKGGRIVDSGIATCATRYPCDVIYTILYQPVQNQSPDVDRVSRATESADAYYYGLVEALKQALGDTPSEQATTAP